MDKTKVKEVVMKTKWAWLKVGVAIVVTSLAFAAVYGCSGGKSGGEIQMPAEVQEPVVEGTVFGQPETIKPPDTYVLTVDIIGAGTVKSGDGSVNTTADIQTPFAKGAAVSLSATPASGSRFKEWAGDCTGSSGCALIMNQDRKVEAHFEAAPGFRTLTVLIGGGGTVRTADGSIDTTVDISHPFAEGATVTLQATPASGFNFDTWEGPCTGAGACAIVMNLDHTVKARFTPIPGSRILNVNLIGSGTVKSRDGSIDTTTGGPSFSVTEGHTVALEATAAAGFNFFGWQDDCTDVAPLPCILVMDRDHTVTARFEPIPVTHTLDIHLTGGDGIVTYVEGGINTAVDLPLTVADGATVTLQAAGRISYIFARWEGDCSGSADCNLVMDGNHSVTAVFELSPLTTLRARIHNTCPHDVSVTADPPGPDCTIVSGPVAASCAFSVGRGSSIRITANAGSDCEATFLYFTMPFTCSASSCEIPTLDVDGSLTINFSVAAPVAPAAPTVVSTSPANNEVGVSLYKTLEAVFNMPMEPTSVTSAFSLKKNDVPVAGTVSPSGSAVKFAPSVKLDPHTTYNATITTAAKNVDGVALAADFSWLFTTVDWTWSKTFPAEFDSTYADMPDVAMDKKGNAAVVWRQAYGVSEGAIYLKIYKSGTVWERTSSKILFAHGNVYNPRVAVNDNDIAPKAVVVWREYSSAEGKWRIYAERFDMKTGRADAEPAKIYDGVWEVKDMDLGLDDEGTATISWIRTRPDGRKDVSAVRTAATAPVPPLSARLLNGSLFVEQADSLQVEVNRAGDAIVVWRGQNGTGPATVSRIGCNYYTKSYSRWAEPGYLDTSSPASYPSAVIDQAGNIMVAWHQAESYVYHIKAKRKVAGSSEWREERTIESATSESAMVPRMAADISGNVIIAWVQGPPGDMVHATIYANRYDSVSRSFGEAVNIGVADHGADFPYVISDESGNGAVVWLQHYIAEGQEKIFAKRYLVGKGWSAEAQEIASASLSDSFNGLRVSGSAVGDGIAVWSQRVIGTSVYDVITSRFQLPQVIMGPVVTPAAKIPASGVRIPSF